MRKGFVTVPDTSNLAARRSPFEGHAPAQRPNAAGQTGVRLGASMLASVTQISTWISGVAGLEQALTAVLGEGVPALTGQTVQTAHGLLVRTGPEELLVIADTDVDHSAWLRRHIASDVGAVTDLSHARCRIQVSGERCRDMLGKLFPIDLRLAPFPVDQARLSGHHHVPCLIHRRGPEQFDLYVFSTYALDQLDTLIDAALEYGVALSDGTQVH